MYDSKYPALPPDLKGETFNRIFGAPQTSLEWFLLEQKIKVVAQMMMILATNILFARAPAGWTSSAPPSPPRLPNPPCEFSRISVFSKLSAKVFKIFEKLRRYQKN